jgi:hypothetical protein
MLVETRELNFDHKIKVRAHKGDMRIGKTPKKLIRPIGEGDQEQEKRLDQEELT